MDQAAHSSLSRRLADQAAAEAAYEQETPQDDVWRGDGIETGFDADALSAMKPSTPAPGSMATPPVDPEAGCALQRGDAWRETQSAPPLPKAVLIDALRAAIGKIEGHTFGTGHISHAGHAGALPQDAWRLGCPSVDRLLPRGLDPGAVHEVKALPHPHGASAGDWMTSLGFALRLAVRRAEMLSQDGPPWMLWCWPRALSAEFGSPSASGLAALGLDPSRLIIVETARAADALVALEDGLKSSSLALAFGIFDCVALTPARRLSLAAASARTPCLLITHPASEASGATATRWRVERQPSAPHRFDPRAPGNTRFRVNLERARAQMECAQTSCAPKESTPPRASDAQNSLGRPRVLEWCDEARTFSLASGMAGHAAGTDRARRSAQ
ncbi:MAG: hypothetical protein HOP09_18120 [Hyphomicrobium sp.]|nr:hypothetical protein [Hyphomicrobium sp.]